MEDLQMSPKFKLDLADKIENKLFELWKNVYKIESYFLEWVKKTKIIDPIQISFPISKSAFSIVYRDCNDQEIDVSETLVRMSDDILIKIAIDLGIDTPDFIPCVPTFKNELKSSSKSARQIFEKAGKQIYDNPSQAIGLCSSTLESILKEILSDPRIDKFSEKDTIAPLLTKIVEVFKGVKNDERFINLLEAIKECCKKIGYIRNSETEFHGRKDDEEIVKDPIYASFIVNATSTMGLFFLHLYKKYYPTENNEIEQKTINDINDLPF